MTFSGGNWTLDAARQYAQPRRVRVARQRTYAEQGARPVGNTPEEFRAFITAETARWGEIGRRAGVTMD
jgi:hypothetical protein